ncbi:S-layer homology domain-containing protein [Paenibacillus sp. GCM10027628]|uniref:S-layer homology domain-containing protein n=1 Tax=Paenibacillus sp. GCM10027628 TaxID=3273413 RepID=UPI00363D180C
MHRKKWISIVMILAFLIAPIAQCLYPIQHAMAYSQNLVINPGFEAQKAGWKFDGSTGVATNYPHSGNVQAWLDPGSSNRISQQVVIQVTGTYTFTGWFATGGAGGTLGIRKTGGGDLGNIVLANNSAHTKYEIPGLNLLQGDQIEVYVTGGSQWVNFDDVKLLRDDSKQVNLVRNSEFDADLNQWEHTNGVSIVQQSSSSTVNKAVYVDDGNELVQKIKVPLTGPYKLSASTKASAGGGTLGVRKAGGTVIKSASVTEDTYSIVANDIVLNTDDEVEVYLTAAGSGIQADSFNFQFDFDKFVNLPPSASNLSVSGNAWVDQTLTGNYAYSSPDGQLEGTTHFRWLVSDTVNGAYVPIVGQSNITFAPDHSLKGKFVKFEVTPVNLFGKEGQPAVSSAVGPILENLIQNPGFDQDKHGWTYDGAYLEYWGTDGVVLIEPGPSTFISQTIKVPASGYYNLLASFPRVHDVGATFGVRFPGGSVIASSDIPQTSSPLDGQVEHIWLEKGSTVEVYFTGINKEYKRVRVTFAALVPDINNANPGPMLNNIVGFEVPNQIGISAIDTDNHHISFKMPYGTDVSALTPAITVSEGANLLQGPVAQDFTNPVTYTVHRDGKDVAWTVQCSIAPKEVTIRSSNDQLVQVFNKSKVKMKSYVRTGMTGVVNRDEQTYGWNNNIFNIRAYTPSYWAGYANRSAYYIRDMAHQMAGAHMLGLDAENFNMLKSFAGTANESSKWYPAWALNFDGSIFGLDHRSDDVFVREVPAVFELVEKAYKMYLWTGDDNYLNDPVLWNYYSKAVTDFISLHDGNKKNVVAEGTGDENIFLGTASYNERGGEHLIEAGDGIASQYQAMLAYAKMLEAKGDPAAAQFAKNAQDLKNYFNTDWGIKGLKSGYVRGYGKDGTAYSDFGKEASWFMPMKQITEPGTRTDDYLNFIDTMSSTEGQRPTNIEAYTYLPDTFFTYGKNETAWKWMKYIIDQYDLPHEHRDQGTNGDYPEVSYTLVSQMIEGLMGVTPNAPSHGLSTISRLPGEVGWLELNHVMVGDNDVDVKHEGTSKTTLRNNSGSGSLTWEVQFAGTYPSIDVEGVRRAASTKTVNGVTVSYTMVNVPVGQSVSAVPAITPTHTDTDTDTGTAPAPTPTPTPAAPASTPAPKPTPTPIPNAGKSFHDLTGYDWAKEAIDILSSQGVINGTSDTTFKPGEKITRADFVIMLVRGLKLKADFTMNFNDVDSTVYFYEALGIAKKLGIVTGVDGEQFNPREMISREDMMVIVDRALEAAGKSMSGESKNDLINFSDGSDISSYAVQSATKLIKAGIIQGYENLIQPKGNMTRAEAAVVLYRISSK